jgi:uncharacterized protein (TIGR02145 family)
MKKTFLLFAMACFAFAGVLAQNGGIANLQVSQRTDGSGLVDIHFDLNGTGASYNLQFEASFDDGANYEPLSANYLTGDLNEILPGTGKHIIWDGKTSHPETFSTQTRVRVIAIEYFAPTVPTLITAEVTGITSSSAISGGNVTDDAGDPVNTRGVVWSTIPNPTLDENEGFTDDGEGIGVFISEISGLQPETIYYVRAYAESSGGVGYGEELSFTTILWVCGNQIFDVDGNSYNTVLIGNRCWMKENLKTTHYSNGIPIEYPGNNNSAWANNIDGAYAWYNNDIGWKDIYGALYNWYAATNTNEICPEGWHLPIYAEWIQFASFFGGFNSSPGGNVIKSCRQANSPLQGYCNTIEHPRWDQNSDHFGTDNYGFSGLPAGSRGGDGSFQGIGQASHWNSAEQTGPTSVKTVMIIFNYDKIYDSSGGIRSGISIRCLKD